MFCILYGTKINYMMCETIQRTEEWQCENYLDLILLNGT
jgi:hypothetical protein